jgi:uncharacterized membrane protein YeaQ/YmgE (transglycosylase-associated protein family)
VGYGSSFTASGSRMRIGVVACGYADGYPRHCGTGSPVLVDGARTGTVGRVSMDMLAVDLSNLPAAGVGSEATLWGHGPGGSVLAIDEVATAAGTIGYELMCAVAPRVPSQRGRTETFVNNRQGDITMGGIIGTIVVGLVVGAIARFLLPGEQKMGWILTMRAGHRRLLRWLALWARPWAGTTVGQTAGLDRMSVVGAVVLLCGGGQGAQVLSG